MKSVRFLKCIVSYFLINLLIETVNWVKCGDVYIAMIFFRSLASSKFEPIRGKSILIVFFLSSFSMLLSLGLLYSAFG